MLTPMPSRGEAALWLWFPGYVRCRSGGEPDGILALDSDSDDDAYGQQGLGAYEGAVPNDDDEGGEARASEQVSGPCLVPGGSLHTCGEEDWDASWVY
jgi:hypothetical protein